MDNSAFRSLLNQNDKSSPSARGASASKASTLGSRARPAMPMTPRSVASHNISKDFARQVAEHTRQADGQPALKKFRSASAPKGTRLAQGYEDRTSLRREHEDERTDKEKKLKELEEMVKKEKIDQATFEKLRDQMGVGGDLGSTHLVKGLDRKLLERIRRGDDLNAVPTKEAEPSRLQEDVDMELDSVLDKDVAAKSKEEHEVVENAEKAELNAQSVTRDEILRRLKESRGATNESLPAPEPFLSERFKKLPPSEKSGKKKFVESVNGRRREVLVITDKKGNTKRKTRWIDPEESATKTQAARLGMEVPAGLAAKHKALLEQEAAAEQEDDDIFAGVGTEYDPLRDIDSESEEDEGKQPKEGEAAESVPQQKPQNYFGTASTTELKEDKMNPLTQDPTILAALKRAAALRQGEEEGGTGSHKEEIVDPDQAEKRKQFLAKLKQREREDAEDMDLGFGESRFGDEDDEAPLWDGDEEGGGKQRKRGPKKRKGDKDNVADVMRVLDGRKKS